jgi:hypothetical protein
VICGCVEKATPAEVPTDARDTASIAAGPATRAVIVNVNVLFTLPFALVAVIVYVVALWVEVGVPLKSPVVVLKMVPAGAEGEIA